MSERNYKEEIKQIQSRIKERKWGQKTVAYTGYSMYRRCPLNWAHTYLYKTIPFQPNIHTVFGTAFHEAFQTWLTEMINNTAKAADELDLASQLKEVMMREYKKGAKTLKEHFSTAEELTEFYNDGLDILEWIKKRRRIYFKPRDLILVGIELPINHPVKGKLNYFGFVDVILYNKRTDRYIIIDIKTSGRGWSQEAKKDPMKRAQLILYKKYFSEQFGIPLEKIDVKFFIVKRKLWEVSDFPQKRVQEIEHNSGKIVINKVTRDFEKFLEECYDESGNIIEHKSYPAIEGPDKKNCTFCLLKNNEKVCPSNKRLGNAGRT